MIDHDSGRTDPPQILIVDDSQVSLRLLAEIFSLRGYQVRPAIEGALALKLAADEAPDLILLDVKMPEMDGYEVCRRLKADERSRDIPVIFISGLGDATDKVKGFEAGGVDYITKPFDSAEILARVEMHLSIRRLQKELEDKNVQLKREIAERDRAQELLSEQEAHYRAIVECFDGYIYICSQDYRVEFMNERFKERTGYDGTGEECYKALHGLDSICPWCLNERVFNGETVRWEVQSPKDNAWMYVVNTPIRHPDGSISKQAMILDITDRKRMEEELREAHDNLERVVEERTAQLAETNASLQAEVVERMRAETELLKLNRRLRMISECNQTVVRARDERSLLEDVCRTIVEVGDYRMAWVGFAERNEEKTVRPAAWVGFEEGYLETVKITWDDTEYGAGPTGRAIRTGAPAFCENTATALAFSPWRAEASARDYRSSIAIPLTIDGHVLGALTMYTHEPRTFEAEEVHLLVDLAGDLAYGIMSLRTREERKKAEKALVESERRMSDIIGFLPDAMFAIDSEGKIIAWNRAMEEMTGVRAERMMGKGDREYALPFYGIRRPVLIDLVFGANEEIEDEYLYVERKGNMLVAEAEMDVKGKGNRVLLGKVGPLYDGAGDIVGAVESLRDITEPKRMERELRASEIRYRTIFENTGTAMIMADEDMIISLGNAEIERITGYSREEIEKKKKWTDFAAPELVEAIREHHRSGSADAHSPKTYETVIQDKSGASRHVFVTVTMIPETRQSVASIIDITERKRLQTQFYAAQKMEAIGNLAGGIAHDFNNILAGIMGYTELLMLNRKTDDDLQDYLGRVYQAGERARSLVQQILTISRRAEQERRPMQAAPVVREVLKLMRASLPTTIEIRQQISTGPDGGVVVADPVRVHQVLMNLCTNAAHAMRARGGVLSVSLSEIEADAALVSRVQDLQEGPCLKVVVSDTGHGMDSTVMERIFEPYFTTKGIGEGTGLGLAVVQGIVKGYGGAITVRSEPGKGTAFDVYLPRIEGRVKGEAKGIEALPAGTESILFVDDEETIADLGTQMLRSLGYKVSAYANSFEALEAFRARPDAFDLVVTDMTMPGLTGEELARELLAIRPGTPIVLCTGFSEKINEERAKEAGIPGFLLKPYSVATLAKTLRRLLDPSSIA